MNPIQKQSTFKNYNFSEATQNFINSNTRNKFYLYVVASLGLSQESQNTSSLKTAPSLLGRSISIPEKPAIMPLELQKRLVKGLLDKIQLNLKENLGIEFNLKYFYFLNLYNVCKLIILKYFTTVFSFSPLDANSELKSSQINFFWIDLSNLLTLDQWRTPGTLLKLLNEISLSLQLPKELQELLRSKNPFSMLERCRQQIDCASLSLFEIGIIENDNPIPEDFLKKSAEMLIQLQKELFIQLKPFIRKFNQTFQNLSKLSEKENIKHFESLINKKQRFFSTDFLNRKMQFFFKSLNSIDKNFLDISNSILESLKENKNHFNDFNLFLHNINNSFFIIVKLSNSIINHINSAEEQFSILNPEKNSPILNFLSDYDISQEMIILEYYLWLAKQIDELFLKPLIAGDMNEMDVKMPLPKKFIEFLCNFISLKAEELQHNIYKTSKKGNKEGKNYSLLIQSLLDANKHEPQIYQQYLYHIVKNFEEVQNNLMQKSLDLYEAFLNRCPLAKHILHPEPEYHLVTFLNLNEKIRANSEKDCQDNYDHSIKFFADLQNGLNNVAVSIYAKKDLDRQGNWISSIKQTLSENFGKDSILEGILKEHLLNLREIKSQFKAFYHYFSLMDSFSLPSIVECWIQMPHSKTQDLNYSWIFDIDNSSKAIKKKKLRAKNYLTSESETNNSSEDLKLHQSSHVITCSKPTLESPPSKINPESSFESHFFLKDFLHQIMQIPPHRFKDSCDRKICEMEQIYHLNHFNWTLEMIESSLRNGQYDHFNLLGPNLIYHLYLAQEQGVTPLYLATEGARHGLVGMSSSLGINCTSNNDNGSIWFRYPNLSDQFYRNLSLKAPLALKTLLKITNLASEDLNELSNQIGNFVILCKEGVKFILEVFTKNNKNINSDSIKAVEDSFNNKMQSLLNLTSTKKNACPFPKPNFSDKISALSLRLKTIEDQLKLQQKHDSEINATIADLCIHLKRIVTAMDLIEVFPQQKFLSMHERNIWVAGQYIAELAGIIISQLQKNKIHTHNLQTFVNFFDLEQILSFDSLRLLEEINLKKGSEYIYGKFSNKQGGVPLGLKFLSETYEISLLGAIEGEGFLPASNKNFSLSNEHSRLINLVSRQVDLIESLVEKKIIT